jgi:hypothetical protein
LTSCPIRFSLHLQLVVKKNKLTKGICQEKDSTLGCQQCLENFCSDCFDHIHCKKKYQSHQKTTLWTPKFQRFPKKKSSFVIPQAINIIQEVIRDQFLESKLTKIKKLQSEENSDQQDQN